MYFLARFNFGTDSLRSTNLNLNVCLEVSFNLEVQFSSTFFGTPKFWNAFFEIKESKHNSLYDSVIQFWSTTLKILFGTQSVLQFWSTILEYIFLARFNFKTDSLRSTHLNLIACLKVYFSFEVQFSSVFVGTFQFWSRFFEINPSKPNCLFERIRQFWSAILEILLARKVYINFEVQFSSTVCSSLFRCFLVLLFHSCCCILFLFFVLCFMVTGQFVTSQCHWCFIVFIVSVGVFLLLVWYGEQKKDKQWKQQWPKQWTKTMKTQ